MNCKFDVNDNECKKHYKNRALLSSFKVKKLVSLL